MNNNQIKVLIGDDTAEYGVKIASRLRESGMYAYTRRKDGNVVFDAVVNDSPDVVVADLTMPNLDAIAMIKKLKELSVEGTEFIVTSVIGNSFIERHHPTL